MAIIEDIHAKCIIMAITYDKKALKKLHKQIKDGKKLYAFKTAFFSSMFWLGFMMIFNYLWSLINKDKHFDLIFFVIWSIATVLVFLSYYFLNLKQWDRQKSLYEESIKYHKKYNPEILKGLD